jgi:3-oxoadipate enol-lactonase
MRVTVDDVTIDVMAEGSGEPIVMLHGFPLSREIWDEAVSQLACTALVIRPDLRGAGASSAPDGPYLMEVLAGDVAAVLDAMNIDRAMLVGHSAGGYVAMAFCRMYSERVAKLALVCSRLSADTARAARERDDLADRIEREGSTAAAIDAYLPRLFAQQTLEKHAPAVRRAYEIAGRNSVRGTAAMLRGMAQRTDSSDIAADLDMPVLIVAGQADRVVTPEEAEVTRRAFPNASLSLLRGSGHLPMLEEPEGFASILAGFLG